MYSVEEKWNTIDTRVDTSLQVDTSVEVLIINVLFLIVSSLFIVVFLYKEFVSICGVRYK